MRRAIFGLTLALTAGATYAQCNAVRYGVPDFDQRRGYLPGNGSMYCVPTSLLNCMGYVANHGRPQALKHSSADWSSMNEYALVDVRDYNMGGWMGTDASGGTGGSGAIDGLVDYMNYYKVGPAIIMGYFNDEDWQVSPGLMWTCLKLNWPSSMCFGRYKWESGHWERKGGHCLTVCAVNNACGGTPSIGFKDPNTDPNTDSKWTQSAFKTGWWDVSNQGHTFDDGYYKMWGPKGQSSNSDDTIRFIDNYFVILPMFCLTVNPTPAPGGVVTLYTVPFMNNDVQPPAQQIDIPGGAALRFADYDPRTLDVIAVTDGDEKAPARLWRFCRADGVMSPILDLPAIPDAFAIDRRGDVLVDLGGDLFKYRMLGDGSVRQEAAAKLGIPLIHIAVDDRTDDIYGLGGRTLLRIPGGDMAGPPELADLPEQVVLGDGACVAVNPADGQPWVCSKGAGSIFQILRQETGGWGVGMIVPAGVGDPTGLQFGDKGAMKFLGDGKIVEFDLDADGRYIRSPEPAFADQPASRFLVLGRSRTNYDARKHSTPAWNNIDDVPTQADETTDCVGDYDLNGFVNGEDFDLFVADFEAGLIDADVDFNGFVNGDDFDTFSAAFIAGC